MVTTLGWLPNMECYHIRIVTKYGMLPNKDGYPGNTTIILQYFAVVTDSGASPCWVLVSNVAILVGMQGPTGFGNFWYRHGRFFEEITDLAFPFMYISQLGRNIVIIECRFVNKNFDLQFWWFNLHLDSFFEEIQNIKVPRSNFACSICYT